MDPYVSMGYWRVRGGADEEGGALGWIPKRDDQAIIEEL
jgi:hypothetical protein